MALCENIITIWRKFGPRVWSNKRVKGDDGHRLESTVSIQEKEAAKNRAVDAILIPKKVQALQAEDDDVIQLNTKAFVTMDIFGRQLSAPTPPVVDSTANQNANGSDK
ncbi:hypothetical protein H5410_040018 [Solanum commersonii]|uniref:Uncharacterized protein n=1 Tax=Solanum commersonii TaxID=4109 RepID=A0A9J5XQW2_SOLCO|nr:hypothetical protein H5410_040018 [Solanum commersonii]